MRKTLMLAATTLTIAATQPPQRPSAAPSSRPAPAPSTLNCLLASNVFAQHEMDRQRKELAHDVLIFYLGRLDARTTAPQLKASLKQTTDALSGVNVTSLMNECLVEFRAKASMVDAVGEQLKAGK